jgi:excisionase family DNA binding protein
MASISIHASATLFFIAILDILIWLNQIKYIEIRGCFPWPLLALARRILMAEGLLLTPEEAFNEIKIGRAKGFQLIASGDLPSIKIGRLRRIPADGLRAWVQRQVDQQTGMMVEEGN